MEQYQYRPVRFYVTCFAVTWAFWITAAFVSRSEHDNGISSLLMLFGLISPAVTAVITVLTSGNKALKEDLKRKLVGFYRIRPLNIVAAVVVFMGIVALSILLSLLAGQSLDQFAFTEDFSFSIGGTSALLTILLAAVIEEVGWRGTERILWRLISRGLQNRLFLGLSGHYGICLCSGLRVLIIMD